MAPHRKVDRRPKRDSRTWLGGRTAFRDQKEKKESLKHPAPHSGTGSTAASPCRPERSCPPLSAYSSSSPPTRPRRRIAYISAIQSWGDRRYSRADSSSVFPPPGHGTSA